METDALAPLKESDDLKQIFRAGIAGWSKHPHKTLRRNVCFLSKLRKSHRSVDIVAQNRLCGGDVAA